MQNLLFRAFLEKGKDYLRDQRGADGIYLKCV